MRLATLVRNPIKVWGRLSYHLHQTRRPNPRLSHWAHQPNLAQSYKILEKILTDNILPFWYPQVIDLEDGGYRLNHDFQGNWKGKTNKEFVHQARTVWFFSRVANTKYGTSDHLEAARHGYNFLINSLWDKQFGGFYWEVDSSGKVATKPDKHLYGQAFGIYALSEYALATGDNSAIALVRELFNLLESHAHDRRYGGYRECFRQDWNLPSENTKDYRNNASPTIKTLDTHLHLLEALTLYYHLTKEPAARERLFELILIQSNTAIRKTAGACTDKYQRN